MKAIIFKIFSNHRYTIEYTYINSAKCHDDIETYTHNSVCVPMMTIRIYNDDETLGDEIITYASPKIVHSYTQIDFFKILRETVDSYEFCIETSSLGYSWEIDFEMKKGKYPYLTILVEEPDYSDRIICPIVEYPLIRNLYKCEHDW